jgi:hypothetical protein
VGSFTYVYDVLHDDRAGLDQHTHGVSASGGFGLRPTDEVRVDLLYAFATTDSDGSVAPLRWGSLQGSVFGVIERRVSLNVWGRGIQSGGGGGVDLGVYPTQNLGLAASGYGERGELYADALLVNRFGALVGVSYWFSPRVRLGGNYLFTYNHSPQQTIGTATYAYDDYEHAFELAAAFRLP